METNRLYPPNKKTIKKWKTRDAKLANNNIFSSRTMWPSKYWTSNHIITALCRLSHGSWQGTWQEYWQTYTSHQLLLKSFSVLPQPTTNVLISIRLYKLVFFVSSFENTNVWEVSMRNGLVKKHTYKYFSRIHKLHFPIILLFTMYLFFTSFNNLKTKEKTAESFLTAWTWFLFKKIQLHLSFIFYKLVL